MNGESPAGSDHSAMLAARPGFFATARPAAIVSVAPVAPNTALQPAEPAPVLFTHVARMSANVLISVVGSVIPAGGAGARPVAVLTRRLAVWKAWTNPAGLLPVAPICVAFVMK